MIKCKKFYLINHVREAREEAGLSQARLAELVCCSRNSIVSIENGSCEPTAYTCALICLALNKRFDELFEIQ